MHIDDGAEVEVEAPAPSDPLTVEVDRDPYTISDCGKYEVIGGRYIKCSKGSQRVLSIWSDHPRDCARW